MMMGQGYYSYGGGSSPSSSNLSALAPPFTVDRSVPKSGSNPLVDLTEPAYTVTFNSSLHNWVGDHPPSSRPDYFSISNSEFDSVPSSNAYAYSSSTAHVPPLNPCVSVSASTNLLEVKPYYPSYVSPAIRSDGSLGVSHCSSYDLLSTTHVATPNGSSNDDYIQSLSGMEHLAQWSGLWDGLVDWQQSEQVQLERSFSSNENFINQGLYATDGMSKYEEATHSIDTIGGDNHAETVVIEKLDYKSFLGENPKFLPTEYSKTSSSTSTLLVPENCSQAPAIKAVNSWNHQMPYSVSYEKCFGKHHASPSDFVTVGNSPSPAVVIRPPDTSSPRNMNPGNDVDNKDFASKDSTVVKESHPFLSSKGYVHFDASQVSFHLQQNDQEVAEFSPAKKEERSNSGDALDNFAEGKPGIQAPHRSLDGFNLIVDKNEAINSVQNNFENLDNYNPAVDSPCWKGAPVSQFSWFEVSEAVTSQNMKKLEVCSGSNLQSHQMFTFSANDAVKSSPEKTSKTSVCHDGWSLGNHSTPLKRPLVANVLPREGIVDAGKSGSQCTNSSCFQGVQISDDAVSNKSTDNSDRKPHKNEQQSCEGAKRTSGKNCAPGFGVNIKSTDNSDHKPHQNDPKSCEDAKWTSGKNCAPGFGIDIEMKMDGNPDDCSSDVPFDAIEHVLHSPPSADDVPTKLSKSHGEESTRKMNVRTLLDTMQNLSELLLFHFAHDACELNEDDYGVLKDVINNLDLCILKNVETMTSLQESFIPQKASSQLHGKSAKLQKDMNVSSIDPRNSEAPFKYQYVQDNELNTVPGKNDEKLPNFGSVRAAADISIEDNMTQAIRKALNESFHVEEETDPQVILYKNLWLEAEASLCSAGCIARYTRMKSEMEKYDSQKVTGLQEYTAFMEKLSREKLSRSRVSTEPGMNEMLASDTMGNPQTGTSIQESSIKSMTKHEDEVAARYHILKCQAESSNSLNTSGVDKTIDFTELPSSKISLNLNNVDKLTCEEKDCQKPDLSIQDSPKLSTTSQVDDFEDSVMARFGILKSRVENMNSVDKEEQQRATNDLGYAGLQRHWPMCEHESEDRILNVNRDSELENHACNSTEDKVTVKEFRLFVKDDPMNNRPGDQFRDGSSDWEHVLLEELAVQNC